MTATYERDFLRWTEEQAGFIRSGRLSELDYAHILEELEDMGREQDEIIEFRAQAQTRLDETPGLKHYGEALFAKAWQQARRGAIQSFVAHGEQVLVPNEWPYSLAQVLDPDYFPA